MADGSGGGGVAFGAGAVTNDRRSGQFTTGRNLTEQQAAFAVLYVANGGRATPAAEEAGYEDAKAAAWRNMRNPAVLLAIREEQARVLFAEVGSASVKVVLDVMRDAGAKGSDKIQAARLGAEMAALIKRDKGNGENPLGNKALSEMSLGELETFISAGNAALAQREEPKLIEGEGHEVEA